MTTKSYLIATINLCLIAPLFSQRTGISQPTSTESVTTIPGLIADGTPPKTSEQVELPKLDLWNTLSRDIYVNRAPLMRGTPRVEGMIRVTMNMAIDPELPKPSSTLPALPPDDPKIVAALEDLRKKYQETELLFLSATVYGRLKTLLTVYPSGRREGAVTVVSNLNFGHFSGVSLFRVTDDDGSYRDYGLLMGVGGGDKRTLREDLELSGREAVNPAAFELPDVRVRGPEFVVIEGEEGKALDTVRSLHELYRTEGRRMEAAFYARQRASAKRKAELIANPPKPEDITITFWERTPKSSKLQSEEAGR